MNTQQQVVSVDQENLEKAKRKIKEAGHEKFHVVSDFDRTVTYGLTSHGDRTPTVISQLRADPKYLGQEYADEAHRLFDHFRPKEIDSKLSLEEKKREMHEWWRLHFQLIARSGFTRGLAARVVKEKPLKFRKGFREFLEFLRSKNIPIVFISASLGDMIVEYLKCEGLDFPNVYVISNRYDFDSSGRATRIMEPIIHTFNKTEASLQDSEAYGVIKSRPNILLMGDSDGDAGMIEGFPYENLIKVAFLNENVEESLPKFKERFDVVLTGDQDFDYVNGLMGEMFE